MKKLIRAVAFFIVLYFVYELLTLIVTPKNFTGNGFPTASTYSDFYELDKNTVDVIFLGSSNAVCAFIPEELYHQYGITGYNLACEQQNLFTSYYWLEEALRYQNPKVVVLDTAMLYLYDDESLIVSREGLTRRAFDFMKWSPVKLKAALRMEGVGESLTLDSFVFPTIPYHERWETININDFKIEQFGKPSLWKGYLPLVYYAGVDEFNPITEEQIFQSEEDYGNEFMLSYLDRIVEFCEAEDIELILTMVPSTFQDAGNHLFLMKYAQENNVQFIDYNVENIYTDSGLDFFRDCHDHAHCNFNGALKVTDYIGEIIYEKIGKSTGDTTEWDDFLPEYLEYLDTVDVGAY